MDHIRSLAGQAQRPSVRWAFDVCFYLGLVELVPLLELLSLLVLLPLFVLVSEPDVLLLWCFFFFVF